MEIKKAIRIVIIAAIVAMVGIGAANAGTNLVVNGGFEDPQLSHGSWTGVDTLPGWTKTTSYMFELQNWLLDSL